MFRLGSLLFIPGYLTVILYRVLASPQGSGGLILMIRECYLRLLRGYCSPDYILYKF
jgi:hypothetical protein